MSIDPDLERRIRTATQWVVLVGEHRDMLVHQALEAGVPIRVLAEVAGVPARTVVEAVASHEERVEQAQLPTVPEATVRTAGR